MKHRSNEGMNVSNKRYLRILTGMTAVAMSMMLLACGDDAPGPDPATGGGGGGGTTPPTTSPSIAIALVDSATGQASNALSLSAPLNATATVRNAAGAPVPNAVVQFTATSAGSGSGSPTTALATFSPASGNGITDANGNVTVVVSAGSVTSQGVGTLTASTSVEGASATSSTPFQVAQANIALQNLAVNPAAIDAFQTATITVNVSGVPATTPVTVNFQSVCASAEKATITASALTVNGVATANYADRGCGQADTIVVSAAGAASVQGTLTVRPASATNLVFVTANPEVIGIQGSGANTSSVVTFKVVNASQQPVPNVAVTMALDTVVGGVTLENLQATQTKTTAVDGTVSTQVIAGTQPTPVRVLASAGALQAVSSNLTIHSGLPTQARFSLSVETFNIEGWDLDGTSTGIIIRAADRVGNPVPDNTVINFRSSGAAIQPACSTAGGVCSVRFTSQRNRPANGRVTVLAYASGLESFDDRNGNNRFDLGEPYEDLGDAFVDSDYNGVWASTEEYIPFNLTATQPCTNVISTTPPPMRPATCDGVWGGAHVRNQAQVILSGSQPALTLPPTLQLLPVGPSVTECSASLNFVLQDARNNPMPAGTKLTTEVSGVTTTVLNDTVPNTTSPTGHGILVKGSTCTGSKVGSVIVRITTPSGLATVGSVTVNY